MMKRTKCLLRVVAVIIINDISSFNTLTAEWVVVADVIYRYSLVGTCKTERRTTSLPAQRHRHRNLRLVKVSTQYSRGNEANLHKNSRVLFSAVSTLQKVEIRPFSLFLLFY